MHQLWYILDHSTEKHQKITEVFYFTLFVILIDIHQIMLISLFPHHLITITFIRVWDQILHSMNFQVCHTDTAPYVLVELGNFDRRTFPNVKVHTPGVIRVYVALFSFLPQESHSKAGLDWITKKYHAILAVSYRLFFQQIPIKTCFLGSLMRPIDMAKIEHYLVLNSYTTQLSLLG